MIAFTIHLWVPRIHLLLWLVLKLHIGKIPYVLVPYQYIGWNDVPQGETYIAYEVFEHLSWVHHEVGGGLANSAKHLQATRLIGLTKPFSSNVYSPIAHKTADFWYPSSMSNELLYCGERYPLLMKCSKSLLGTWRRYEVLLAASASYLWISSCHFGWLPISNYTQNTKMFLLTFLVW